MIEMMLFFECETKMTKTYSINVYNHEHYQLMSLCTYKKKNQYLLMFLHMK